MCPAHARARSNFAIFPNESPAYFSTAGHRRTYPRSFGTIYRLDDFQRTETDGTRVSTREYPPRAGGEEARAERRK